MPRTPPVEAVFAPPRPWPALPLPQPRWLRWDHNVARELARQPWHILPGLIPFALWYHPHADPISPSFRWFALGLIASLSLIVFRRIQPMLRPGESNGTAAVLGYSLSVLATLLLFPGQAELAMTVLVVLAFGDGLATIGGTALISRPLPWNPDKSWAGTCCFVLFAAPLATLAYWGEAQPAVPLAIAAACGTAAALAGAAVESLSTRLNDNIRVGFAAAVTVALAHELLVGWS